MEEANLNNPVGFYFSLSFEGEDIAFKEVSGLSKEMGIEEIASNDENRFKFRLPTVTSSQNLILKRALVPSDSKLIKWCIETLDSGLANPIETQDISISLLDQNGDTSIKWMFFKAYPVKYSVSDFNSINNDILIETIELAYTYFQVEP